MRVEAKTVEHYGAYLKDKHRPPSRGGNTGAWHSHVLTIDGEKYSFFARGTKKWVFAGDLVSFDWEWDKSNRYRDVITKSLITVDKNGNIVVRGERTFKPWRTATTRLPARRSEWKD